MGPIEDKFNTEFSLVNYAKRTKLKAKPNNMTITEKLSSIVGYKNNRTTGCF